MYYVLVPQKVIKERGVFTDNEVLPAPDNRTVLALSDLRFTSFSYGPVEIINAQDLNSLRVSLQNGADKSNND